MRVQELHSGSYHKHKQPASSPGGRVVLNLRKWVSLRKCYLCLAEGFREALSCCCVWGCDPGLPAWWGQRGDGHCTVCRCHQGDTRKCLLVCKINPRRSKIGGPGKNASFHRGSQLAGKSSLLIHESFDEFSVFQAIPAAKQVSSGLGFCRGWKE